MAAVPILLDVRPIDDDTIETIEELDTLVETVMCSCSAGDDQPY
jgi:hypothetical protein